MTVPDAQAIADIDRCLKREDLTALDRDRLIVRRNEIYHRLHPARTGSHPSDPEPEETP